MLKNSFEDALQWHKNTQNPLKPQSVILNRISSIQNSPQIPNRDFPKTAKDPQYQSYPLDQKSFNQTIQPN